MSLSYTDPVSGFTWKQDLFAATLVKPGDGLPPNIGEFRFVPLDERRHGFGEHPLRKHYPNIAVQHYAMVVPTKFYVSAPDGTRGVAFWVNNNGSDMSASVTSEMGRANVAPLQWKGEDAVAHPFWEWRNVIQDGKPYLWTNARGHGFAGLDGRDANYDWLDGTPTDLTTMYDRERGKTAQSVVVPRMYEIGTAAQTVPADALVGTYSIMVYFPRREAVPFARKLMQFSSLLTTSEAMRMGGTLSYGSTNRRDRGDVYSKSVLESLEVSDIQPEFEVTHGFEVKQHVLMPPMFPNFWQSEPSVVFVCWPVSPEQEGNLASPDVEPGREGFGWKKK